MVAFSSFVVTLFAVAGSLASPTAEIKRADDSPANFVLGRDSLPLQRRSSVNYKQDYTTGGDVSFSTDGNYFSVNWDTSDDFVVGLGWTPGSSSPITFSVSFGVGSGVGMLSVYGWSENPLVEYYVIEDSHVAGPFGTEKGTLYSDGSDYTFYENTRVNEPSIVGTATFNQYISVRSSPRTSGTVTIQNHFLAWYGADLKLGSLNYQVIAVEGWGGEGSASQSVSD